MKEILLIFTCFGILTGCNSKKSDGNKEKAEKHSEKELLAEFENAANEDLLAKWYPLVIDKEDGGYYSEVTHDFKMGEKHDKMVVTQARHIWTNAKAAKQNPEDSSYLANAQHGFEFSRDVMWWE